MVIKITPSNTGGGGGTISAADVIYGDGTVEDALNDLTFVPMTVSLVGGTVNEIGQSIPTVSLAWAISKDIQSQTLTGLGTVPPALSDRTQLASGPYTTNQTFTLEATSINGDEVVSDSTSLLFRNRRHWGISTLASLTTADILTLSGNELSASRTQTRTFDATGGYYLWFAWPVSFGQSEFWVGGLLNTAWVETVVTHTNQYGHTEDYYTYRSEFIQNGASIEVEVR